MTRDLMLLTMGELSQIISSIVEVGPALEPLSYEFGKHIVKRKPINFTFDQLFGGGGSGTIFIDPATLKLSSPWYYGYIDATYSADQNGSDLTLEGIFTIDDVPNTKRCYLDRPYAYAADQIYAIKPPAPVLFQSLGYTIQVSTAGGANLSLNFRGLQLDTQ